MKQQIISAGLALMLTNNLSAISVASPDKELPLDLDHSQNKQPNGQLAPSSRGELLYLNHCLICHESNVHIREKHSAINIGAIRGEVTRWAKELQLKWSPRDIEDVVDYLNNRYYRYSE
jgi:mono/diheme cytochrome c family protein